MTNFFIGNTARSSRCSATTPLIRRLGFRRIARLVERRGRHHPRRVRHPGADRARSLCCWSPSLPQRRGPLDRAQRLQQVQFVHVPPDRKRTPRTPSPRPCGQRPPRWARDRGGFVNVVAPGRRGNVTAPAPGLPLGVVSPLTHWSNLSPLGALTLPQDAGQHAVRPRVTGHDGEVRRRRSPLPWSP